MSDLVAPPDKAPVLAQEFKVTRPCALVVDVPGAHTRLRPGSQDGRTTVDVTITGATGDAAEAVMDRLQLSTRQINDTVHITATPPTTAPDWWRWLRGSSATVYLDITLPSQVEADVHVSGGAIDAANLAGHFTLTTSGGQVRADGLSGTLSLHSRSSTVSVREFSGDRLAVRAAAGRTTVRNATADQIALRAAGAPLTAENVRGALALRGHGAPVTINGFLGRCRGRVQGAALTFAGTPDADTHLTTVGAPLTAQLPAQLGAALSLSGASLMLDDAFAFEGKRTSSRIAGTLNAGGPVLRLRAVHGAARCETQA